MSKIWRPFGFACLLAATLLMTTSALRADTGPSVRVTSAVGQGVVRLDAKANGPFEYTMHHPSPDLYIINLSGVTASATDAAQVLGTNLVRSYRLEQYENGHKTASQLEILVGDGATPKVERQGPQEIVIVVSKKDVLSASSLSSNSPRMVNTALHSRLSVTSINRTPTIQEISIAKNGETPEVLVLGSGLLKPHDLRLSNPDRLVLDFAAARITAPKRTPSSVNPIRDVRAGQFSPQVARVVIDLSETGSYAVNDVDGGIAVEFPAATASPVAQATQISDPPASEGASKSNLPLPDDASQDSSAGSAPAPKAANPDSQVQPDSQQSTTQSTSTTSAVPPATTPATPAALPSTSPQSAQQPDVQQPNVQQPPAPMAVTPSATVPPVASPSSVSVSAPSSAVPVAVITQQSVAGTAGVKYTGAPTSLNFKDLDVLDFFRLIHELSGLNVVVDPDVKGRLTIVLDNVPWDQALDIVLRNFDLDKQVDGNVIRIATKATMKREADEAKDLAKAQVEAADLVTTTRVLNYAKAADLVETIKKFLSSRGDVLADTRTNTLIISDVPSVLPVVDNLIRELDKRSQQVEIEARVVAANRSFSREIGSQFAFAGSATGGRSIFGGNPNVGGSPLTHNPPLPVPPLIMPGGTGNSLPLASNLGATVATSGLSYAFSSANFALDYLISAAEAKGVGKLLSKPKLVTQNNMQALVKQGTKIPIQTVVNNTISVQFVDAVLELQVTPQITADGTIFMNIHVENTQIDPAIPRVNGIPALDTEGEDTQVTVNDGATIMVGGIIISSQRTDIEEVPYVGSLPIIGRLFRHSTVSTTSQELLFFITPRILPM
ncbi:MAG TPA: type IV pilus secretin PilQ [Candidatus Acidoferrales bacterium]|nr:type IV pilus secretin PilQ [Candidatus Acidoferrales bacterium]